MAHSNYKVLTNADLSGNEIYNVSGIVNNEEDSKSLSIETKGDTTLRAAKLTGTVDGETSLTTNTSNVEVTSTATETITTSKITTVASTTTEKIDVDGITITTPSQKVTATGSAKTVSPSIIAITEEEVGKGAYSKVELSKGEAAATITAKKYTVDADVAGGTITQTAPTSTYKADSSNRIELNTSRIAITSGDEVVQLNKGNTTGSTAVTSEDLQLHATKLTVDRNTSITSASSGTVTFKSNNSGDSTSSSGSTATLTNAKATIVAPSVVIEGKNNTTSEGCQVQAKVGSTSITVAPQDIKLDSDGTLRFESDGNAEIKTTDTGTSITLDTKNLVEKATTSSSVTSPSIKLVTESSEGTGVNKQAKIALTKTVGTDDSKIDISARTVVVDTTDSITQTAPTSIYKADSSNQLSLTTSSVEIKSSDAEIFKLTKAVGSTPSSTDLTSKNLNLHAGAINVNDNTSITSVSKGAVTIKSNSTGKSDNGSDTTLTLNNTTASLTAPIVSIISNSDTETADTYRKISAVVGGTSATIKTTDINLTSAGTTEISSTGNTTIKTTGAGTTLKLDTKNLVESAATMRLYSGDTVLQPSDSDDTKQISLKGNTVTVKADSASVTAVGGASNTVTITGTELAVDSTKSTFKNNATFDKNVTVTGDLTTANMTGEAATLNSLDVEATTTVNGKLSTGNLTLEDVTGTSADLKGKLTVNNTTQVNTTATTGTLTVTGNLAANGGLESTGKVTISNQGGAELSLTVNNTASTGTLTVHSTKTLEANGGLVSTGKVSVNGKDTNDVSVTVKNTAETGTLKVANELKANGGLTSTGKVAIQNTGSSSSSTSLTVNKTASTDNLTVKGTLTASSGLISAGAVKIEKASGVENALTVNTSATTSTLTVNGELAANNGMTSNGKVTVSGTTDIATLTGLGSLTIPTNQTLEATNGGTTGSIDVSNVTINTVNGLGSLTIPGGKTLKADTVAGSTAKVTGDFTPTNINVNTITGLGSIEVAGSKTLKIDPASSNEAMVTGNFTPTNISVGTVKGNGSISISSGKTLTVNSNGIVNGSMIVGKSDSTATNVSINGTLTVGANGSAATSLTSKVPIAAESTLKVTDNATFSKNVTVADSIILNGVTIKWDSTLGALTFSR